MSTTVNYDVLKLDNQICFPLYACSKEIVRRYTPFLEELDLTYTQYIAMMAIWETDEMSVSDLGKRLYLDSGTLTPLLKKLEAKGYVERKRSATDERKVVISATKAGMDLRDKAVEVPAKLGGCIDLDPADAVELHRILRKMMASFAE